MSKFNINLNLIRKNQRIEKSLEGELKSIAKELTNIAESSIFRGGNYSEIRKSLNYLSESMVNNKISIENMNDTLDKIIKQYEQTENSIISNKKKKEVIREALNSCGERLKNAGNNGAGNREESNAYAGDPVNVCNGNYVDEIKELSINTIIPLEFIRYYNSAINKKSVLGIGWSHNYERQLKIYADSLDLIWGDGNEEHFRIGDNNVYYSTYGSYKTIIETEEGYLLKENNETEKLFDKDGKLRIEKDKYENLLRFYYKNNLLSKVTMQRSDGTEKEGIYYFYNELGLLIEVRDFFGRKIKLTFDDELLKEVISVDNEKTTYDYDQNDYLNSITNSLGLKKLNNEYYTDGRIKKQILINGGELLYEYNDKENETIFTDCDGTKKLYTYDDKLRHIKTKTAKGIELFEYNEKNTKVVARDRNGNVLKRTFDNRGNITGIIDAFGNKSSFTYDSNNRLISMKDMRGGKITWKYNSKGNLTEVINQEDRSMKIYNDVCGRPEKIEKADGSEVRLTYYVDGNIISIEEDGKGTISYTYDLLGRVIESIDGEGNKTNYEYDLKDRIIKVVNAERKERIYCYNALGQVESLRDYDGVEEKWNYGKIGKPISHIDKEGRKTEFFYDLKGNISAVVQPNGAKSCYYFDNESHLENMTDALGNELAFKYDANGNRIEQIDACGNHTYFKYDAMNRNIATIDAEGNIEQIEYDANGNITEKTDALGNIEKFYYNALGKVVEHVDVSGNKTQYTYTELGDIRTIEDAVGRKMTYEYYLGGLLKCANYPDGRKESFTYNKNGDIRTRRTIEGYELVYDYDNMNRVVSIRSNHGQSRYFAYDSMGNIVSVKDANGNITSYTYSATGKLVKVVDACRNPICYDYDETDQLISINRWGNEGIQSTIYERNMLGQVTCITNPIGMKKHFTYDAMGRLLQKKDEEGYITTYSYSKNGDLNQIDYADGTSVMMEYDGLRRLTEMKDWLGITKIEYDVTSRVKKVHDFADREIAYQYGQMGECTSIIYPDGEEVHYEYDEDLRLSKVMTPSVETSYFYNEFGRLCKKEFSNGTGIDYLYNSIGLLSKINQHDKDGALEQLQYTYDAVGNKTGILKQRRGLPKEGGKYKYNYDELGRITTAEKDNQLLREYTYDAFGNRCSMKDYSSLLFGSQNKINESLKEPVTSYKYYYNAANQLIKRVKDLEGELKGEITSYLYDKRGNLNSVTKNEKIEADFAFNAVNRLSKVNKIGYEQIKYSYNGFGHRICEDSLKVHVDYIVDITKKYNNLLVKQNGVKKQKYIWDNGIMAMQEDENNYTFLLDELGSPIRVIGDDGEAAAIYGYDEFGVDLFDYNHTENYSRQGEVQPFGFTGYRIEDISGLYFAQAREYSSIDGRFISEDLIKGNIKIPGMLNYYTYCLSNPISLVDLDGKAPKIVEDLLDEYRVDDIEDAIGAANDIGSTYSSYMVEKAKGIVSGLTKHDLKHTFGGKIPSNVEANLWKRDTMKVLSNYSDVIDDCSSKINKGLIVVDALKTTVDDIKDNKSNEYIITDVGVNSAEALVTMIVSDAIASAVTGSIAGPGGTVVGFIAGVLAGVGSYVIMNYEWNGKSIKNRIKDIILKIFNKNTQECFA